MRMLQTLLDHMPPAGKSNSGDQPHSSAEATPSAGAEPPSQNGHVQPSSKGDHAAANGQFASANGSSSLHGEAGNGHAQVVGAGDDNCIGQHLEHTAEVCAEQVRSPVGTR